MTASIPRKYRLPAPPTDHDQNYLNQLIRQLEQIVNELQHPSQAQAGGMIFDIDSLPASGANLRPGTVFRDGAMLKIARVGYIYAGGLELNISGGAVTVVTT